MNENDLNYLLTMDKRDYGTEVKLRLRDDKLWEVLLHPSLSAQTRNVLNRMIDSIEMQKERSRLDHTIDMNWVYRMNTLQKYVKIRLSAMGPSEGVMESRSKESRAWRHFSARLAQALIEQDWEAVDEIKTPYGDLTARQWLYARKAKEDAQ